MQAAGNFQRYEIRGILIDKALIPATTRESCWAVKVYAVIRIPANDPRRQVFRRFWPGGHGWLRYCLPLVSRVQVPVSIKDIAIFGKYRQMLSMLHLFNYPRFQPLSPWEKRKRRREQNLRYQNSEKGRAACRAACLRYEKSDKGRTSRHRYRNSEKGHLRNLRFKEKNPEYHAERRKREKKNCGAAFRTGRWTEEEHVKFLDGLEHFGRKWKQIAATIPSRTATQVNSHAQSYFAKLPSPA
eukprot:g447.t1